MKKLLRRSVCICLMIMLVAGCTTTLSYGATKVKKMTAYTQCIKDGNVVYCNLGAAIYKVNLKKGTKKKIWSLSDPEFESFAGMKLKNGYLYLAYTAIEDSIGIYRVKTNGKSKKRLADFNINGYSDKMYVQYAVKGKKIYYTGRTKPFGEGKFFKKQMNLNGKHKSKSKYKVKTKYLKTNKKGYRIIGVSASEYSDTCKYYLKTPSKKIYITKIRYCSE